VIAKGVNLELIEAILNAIEGADLMAKVDVLATLINSHPTPDETLLPILAEAKTQLLEAASQIPNDKVDDLADNKKGLMNDWPIPLQLEVALYLIPKASYNMGSALRIRAKYAWENHPLAKVQFYAAELVTKATFTDRYYCKDLALETVKKSQTPDNPVLLSALVDFADKMMPEPRIVEIFEYVIPLNKDPLLLRRIFDIAKNWNSSSLISRSIDRC
jgi:hypothetical protein